MNLTESQKKHLRGLGHKLKPVILVGNAGISEALLKEFDSTIGHHELIKVRFQAADRQQRDEMVDELCKRGAASLVTRIGNTAVLYRRNPDAPKLELPPR